MVHLRLEVLRVLNVKSMFTGDVTWLNISKITWYHIQKIMAARTLNLIFKFVNIYWVDYVICITSPYNVVCLPTYEDLVLLWVKNRNCVLCAVFSGLSVAKCIWTVLEGEAHLISMVSQRIIHKYRFKRPVSCLHFSPDGKHFAACKDNNGK